MQPRIRLGGYVGIAAPGAFCEDCFGIYLGARSAFPDKTIPELVELVKTLYALETLSDFEKVKLRRLILMYNNDSRRARRLVDLALGGAISLHHLLRII
jgi:hypothetical protein